MARPKPWPAPVTITVLSRNAVSIGSGRQSRRLACERVDVGAIEGAPPLLDLVDHGGEPGQERRADAVPGGLANHGAHHRLNPRFLILPWIKIPNLGSHILALIRRRLPDDWTERYNTAPVLVETFVETPRYTGAVYKASGWIHVGATKGRGRYDRDKLYDKPRKDIWLRPLRKDWKHTLNR